MNRTDFQAGKGDRPPAPGNLVRGGVWCGKIYRAGPAHDTAPTI